MRRCYLSSFLGLLVFLGSMPAFPQATRAANGIVEGIVLNSITGQPIPGARVKLAIPNSGQDPVYAMTDEQGHFTISDLGQTRYGYLLTAERPGFMRADNSPGEMQQAAVTYPRQPSPQGGETPPPSNKILLLPYGVIAGKITDPNGVAMARIPVSVSLDGRSWTETTNDLGEYRAAFLKPGTYYVVASKASFSDATWESSYHQTYFPAALDVTQAQGVELAAGQEARADIQIVRVSGVRVAGRVRASQTPQSPAETVRQTLFELKPSTSSSSSKPDAKYVSSNTDAFEFAQVPPGRYMLTATTIERPATSHALEDQKSILGARAEISVPDRDVDGLQVEMKSLPDIRGKVTFAEGCSSRVVVGVATIGPAVPKGISTMSNEDGSFVLTGLNPGRLTRRVWGATLPIKVTGMRLGDSELVNDSFDYPLSSPADLQISVGCEQRRAKR